MRGLAGSVRAGAAKAARAALNKAAAEALVAKAHEVCPYSSATRGNIDVTFHINV